MIDALLTALAVALVVGFFALAWVGLFAPVDAPVNPHLTTLRQRARHREGR